MNITLGRGAAAGIGAAILISGLAVGGGAFLGGYVLGERSAPAAEAGATERVYTAADLEAAMVACGIDGVQVKDGAISLPGADHPTYRRQCVVLALDAPARAEAEYMYVRLGPNTEPLEGGTYEWSNLEMTWT